MSQFSETKPTPAQLEDDLAVDVLMNMVNVNDIPDIQRLALACLQTRLSLLAKRQDFFHLKSGGRLNSLIAPEEKFLRSISITDLNSILNNASPAPAKKRKHQFNEHHSIRLSEEEEEFEREGGRSRGSSFDVTSETNSTSFRSNSSDHHRNSSITAPHQRRRQTGAVYEFLNPGCRVRVLKTGQVGTVVGEKNGGWRIIETINSHGVKMYGTYRPSDMIPHE